MAMMATDFEYRHQTLVHRFIVAAAFLTYIADREDIVWRIVKDSSAPRGFERFCFIVATVFVAAGAAICTWARVCHRPRYFGDLLYAIGLASLVPLWGFILLVAGEVLRISRLLQREDSRARNFLQQPLTAASPLLRLSAHGLRSRLGNAFRQETVKWGLVLTMVVFVITLRDRLAEVLAGASFFIGLIVNAPIFSGLSSTGD